MGMNVPQRDCSVNVLAGLDIVFVQGGWAEWMRSNIRWNQGNYNLGSCRLLLKTLSEMEYHEGFERELTWFELQHYVAALLRKNGGKSGVKTNLWMNKRVNERMNEQVNMIEDTFHVVEYLRWNVSSEESEGNHRSQKQV